MVNVYFICGFVGSGKTTYSKRLANEVGAFRFSMDEWMMPLYGENMEREVFDHRLNTLEKLFQDSTLQLVGIDVPVIFDIGYWKESDRASALEWASGCSLTSEIHYIDTSFATCKQRALARNQDRKSKSYEMTSDMLELFWSWFEEPKSTEEVLRVSST